MKLNAVLLTACTIALSACASASPVMDAGDGTYFISARASPARGGTTGAHTVAYQDAQQFCLKQSPASRPVLVGSSERDVYQSSIGGAWGGGSGGFSGASAAAGSVNMRFRCAS